MHERQQSAHTESAFCLEKIKTKGEENEVDVQSLSDLTGFPVDFIKKELLIDSEGLTMDELRANVLDYLDQTFDQLK